MRVLIIGGLIALGVVFVTVMANLKQTPYQENTTPAVYTVRAMVIDTIPFKVSAIGFGAVKARSTWQAVVGVGGEITWRHPNLKSGALIAKDTRVLQVDPTQYKVAMQAAEANIATTEYENRQLTQEQEHLQNLIAIENKKLALIEGELAQIITLSGDGSVSMGELEEQKDQATRQRITIQSLERQLYLIPDRRSALMARLADDQKALEKAEEELAGTEYIAPFDIRLHRVDVDLHQQVIPGQMLFIADSIDTVEVTIQVPLTDLRKLFSMLYPDESSNVPVSDLPLLTERLDLDDIQATVVLADDPKVRWAAQVTQIGSELDPATQTVPVVLAVKEPYRYGISRSQSPLIRDMAVRGVLSAVLPTSVVIVPVSAIHQGAVHLVGENNRTEYRQVSVGWVQQELAFITEGLKVGDKVVVGNPVPAVKKGFNLKLLATAFDHRLPRIISE